MGGAYQSLPWRRPLRMHPPPEEIGGIGRLPLLAELAGYRERLGPILASTVLPFALVVYLALERAATTSSSAARWGWPSGGSCCWAPWSGCSRCARWGGRSRSASASCSPSRPGRPSGSPGRRAASEAWRRWAASSPSWAVLALSLSAQDREALRRTVRAVGSAIALVGSCPALAPRALLVPGDELGSFLPSVETRLAYPLNYWNGLAALMALGIPLVLVVAVESRRLITQALATAAIPVMALTAYFTLSRGGAIEIAVALTVLLALHPRRLELLPTLALGAGARRSRSRRRPSGTRSRTTSRTRPPPGRG